MNIHIIRTKATDAEIKEMLEALGSYIKLAVDIRREVVAGGGMLHADCEAALLDDGSKQVDIWGADWLPDSKEVRFEALINIRPRQKNRSMTIENQAIRHKVDEIVKARFGVEKS
ncbi:MAG: DUF5674 family protein [Candidatus Omnitrophica bacterium]|nr:DUF5674 family protein [Candidatus Omnitrophota bacterium]